MPYHFDRVVPQRIVLTRIYGVLKPEEVTEILIESRARTLSSQQPVHFVIDLSALEKQSFTPSKLKEWSSILPSRSAGWWVVINPNAIAMFAVTLVSKALHVKVKSAQSVEEAIRILENIDQTLIEPSLAT